MNIKRAKKILVVLVDRANYGRLKPVMKAIDDHPDLDLSIVCSGTMVLERFGRPVRVLEDDGFIVNSEIFIELEGSNPSTMAKSLGLGIVEFSSEFARINPDVVLLIGDRYECLAAALAASYMNFCIAHIQGGEVSGSIDESARHCITKLSHYHFPSTQRSADFLVRMGELPASVFHVGCPSGDIARSIDRDLPENIFLDCLGNHLASSEPYMLVVFHPVTTHFSDGGDSVEKLLKACQIIGNNVIWLWPNIDAGSDIVSASIRRFRENNKPYWLRLVKNFSPDDYLRVLSNAVCAIGNSSSFVRDSSFFGTPVVLVGDRQHGRECSDNVLRVKCEIGDIVNGINAQINHGPYSPSQLYGDGNASMRIVDRLSTLSPYIQKRLGFVDYDS